MVRCFLFASISECLGDHFVVLGLHFGSLWIPFAAPGGALDFVWTFQAMGSNFEAFPGKSLPHVGVPVGAPNLKSCRKAQTKCAPRAPPRRQTVYVTF